MKTTGPTTVMLLLLTSAAALGSGEAAAGTAECIQTFQRCIAVTPLQGTACTNALNLCKAQDALHGKTTSDSATKLKDAGALGAGRLEVHTDPIKAPANATKDKCAAAITNGASILPPGCSLGDVTVKKDPAKEREAQLKFLCEKDKAQRAKDFASFQHDKQTSLAQAYDYSNPSTDCITQCWHKEGRNLGEYQQAHICNDWGEKYTRLFNEQFLNKK